VKNGKIEEYTMMGMGRPRPTRLSKYIGEEDGSWRDS
jgi:hypothetical protein